MAARVICTYRRWIQGWRFVVQHTVPIQEVNSLHLREIFVFTFSLCRKKKKNILKRTAGTTPEEENGFRIRSGTRCQLGKLSLKSFSVYKSLTLCRLNMQVSFLNQEEENVKELLEGSSVTERKRERIVVICVIVPATPTDLQSLCWTRPSTLTWCKWFYGKRPHTCCKWVTESSSSRPGEPEPSCSLGVSSGPTPHQNVTPPLNLTFCSAAVDYMFILENLRTGFGLKSCSGVLS